MTQHQGFVQGLNYFYIFFAIGKQGIATRRSTRGTQSRFEPDIQIQQAGETCHRLRHDSRTPTVDD